MFSRRRRSVQPTAYTGVNHVAPASDQPNSNALAAALTIGQALKAPPQPNSANGSRTTGGMSRSNSMQIRKGPPPTSARSNGSLLKRSPSLTASAKLSRAPTITSINQPVTYTHHKPQPSNDLVYDIDDTFDESYHDLTSQGSVSDHNYAKMQDLKLAHPLSPPPAHNNHNAAPKMVKKYIPTPNGIKVIEVPESTYQKEMSRHNSLRAGSNIPKFGSRANSLRSNKQIPRSPSFTSGPVPRKQPLRLSSLVRASERPSNNEQISNLQKEIEEEKKLAKNLEDKRLEYEELKLRRLENEKKLLQLMKEEELEVQKLSSSSYRETSLIEQEVKEEDEEEDEEDVPIRKIPFAVDELDKPIAKPQLAAVVPEEEDVDDDTKEEDEITKETIPEASIKPSDVVVDELEKEQIKRNSIISNDDVPNEISDLNKPTEIGIIDQYEHFHSAELLSPKKSPTIDTNSSNYEDDEPEESKSDFAKSLRPKFDEVPEVIDDTEVINAKPSVETLQIPAPINAPGSSGSSIVSVDSITKKKQPVKSAMKNSTSFYNSSHSLTTNGTATNGSNAAHQAYLSLTTAENTRLNSKLSSSQLNDINVLKGGHQYPAANGANRRSVQTPPKKPPQQFPMPNGNGALSGRSLRPHSVHADHYQQGNNGMSGRTLRDKSGVYVQPIPAHPTFDPNYKSPSKTRAAELYARAQARPKSVFNPPNRQSSFDKGHLHGDGQVQSHPSQQFGRSHRMTLRDEHPQPIQQQQQPLGLAQPLQVTPQKHVAATAPAPAQGSHFQSRLADSDSDGESNHAHKPSSARLGFSSRFADSDNEDDHIASPVHVAAPASPTNYITTLRPEAAKEAPRKKQEKEKPKKKRFLRKIFGRD